MAKGHSHGWRTAYTTTDIERPVRAVSDEYFTDCRCSGFFVVITATTISAITSQCATFDGTCNNSKIWTENTRAPAPRINPEPSPTRPTPEFTASNSPNIYTRVKIPRRIIAEAIGISSNKKVAKVVSIANNVRAVRESEIVTNSITTSS
jgi:hypothetical protein